MFSRRDPLKDNFKEVRLFVNRTVISVIAIFGLILLMLAQMYRLQLVSFEHYHTLSQENRVKTLPLPPRRGLIYDRKGTVLAENVPSFALTVTPEQVDDLEDSLNRLEQIITITEEERLDFEEQRKRSRRFNKIPLKFRLTEEEVARFAINRHEFPGIDVEAQLSRFYPELALASHVIGYVGRINERELQTLDESRYSGTTHTGKTGLEKRYEDVLQGQVGYQRVEVNAVGRVIREIEREDPIPGNDIHITLDARLQAYAEEEMGTFNGSVIAIEPSTGEVLAMVSKPGFDLNLFVNGISRKNYAALNTDRHRPLFDRAVKGQYPPGSTIKPLMGLAGLHYGVVNSVSSTYCPGFFMLPGVDHRYRCWKHWGHGEVNLHEAIRESCDVYFYDMSYTLGIDRMSAFMRQFGLGEKTQIDLPDEKEGIYPSRTWKRANKNEPWYDGETIITSIGQGFTLTTPIQLAYATATLANRGQPVRPRLLQSIYNTRLGTTEAHHPEGYVAPIQLSQEPYWQTVINSMEAVVHSPKGTAHKLAKDITYQMAGKTGTAQVYGIPQDAKALDPEELAVELRDHALFIAFAPVQSPRIAVAVIVEHGGSGGSVAGPIARKVIDFYLKDQ